MPDGKIESFSIHESSILSPELQALHPEIRTYKGQGVQHPEYIIRFSTTTQGFNAIILGVGGDTVMFEKIKGSSLYKSYFSRDAKMPKKHPGSGSRCGTDLDFLTSVKKQAENKNSITTAKFTNGGDLKKFRLAVAATGEYTTAFGGGNANNAFNTIVAYANEVNAVFETELAARLELVSGLSLVYTDAATDPYTATDQIEMLTENNTNLNNVIGSANYDIGHVFGAGGSGSGGGVASSPSVCTSGKGRGASDIGNEQYYARVFSIQLIAHEIGHQFGMSHSYNSNIPVCTTRSYTTSVEPGSGATIMSYGFTCSNNDPSYGVTGDDDYSNEYDNTGKKIGPFLNFHKVSINQALDYIATLSCYTTITMGNFVPVINNTIQTAYIIPKSTPFYLKGLAIDTNAGDVLSYSWEGTNISDLVDNPDGSKPADLDGSVLDDTTHPPFFRSYPPVNSGANPGLRYYPLLSAILNGTNKAKGDKLPSVPVTTTHSLTVRDGKGGVATEDVMVTVDSSGPFLITNDPTDTHSGGSSMNVTWSVNGTNNAPVNCKLVDIWLSTDGGYTFSTQLANAVANNGTANLILPNVSTTKARIKVMPSTSTASGNVPNVFFDISNTDFTISGSTLGTQNVNYSDIQIYRSISDIIINSDIQTIYSVELYDRSARSLYKKSNINSHKVTIPSDRYSKHILIVKVITNRGEIVTKKIIID